jgi:hypothetical protein
MHKPKIFLLASKAGTIATLVETDYLSEDILQDMLATHPDLLPGDQISPEDPCRWLLVKRELGVPDSEEAGARWSLDHLFLDQHGTPTFVECKRAADTRARREVVAQMLDYAANGIEYWGIDVIRQAATETATADGTTLDSRLQADLLVTSTADYWDAVEANLRERRVRLVFVADRVPKELRRLVEFLNEEMERVEVLAVEVRQYSREEDPDSKAIVPRVLGITERAREKPGQRRTRSWNEKQFFLALADSVAPSVAEATCELYRWMQSSADNLSYGSGVTKGSITYRFSNGSAMVSVFSIYTDGKLQLGFRNIRDNLSIDGVVAFHQEVTRIPSLAGVPAELDKYPSVPLTDVVADESNRESFQQAVKALCSSVRGGTA